MMACICCLTQVATKSLLHASWMSLSDRLSVGAEVGCSAVAKLERLHFNAACSISSRLWLMSAQLELTVALSLSGEMTALHV